MHQRKIILPGSVPMAAERSAARSDLVHQKRLQTVQLTSAIYPLTAPGLPVFPANSAFLSHVAALGDTESGVTVKSGKTTEGKKTVERTLTSSPRLTQLIQDALRCPDFTLAVEVGPHQEKEATFVPGHLWGDPIVDGPRQADVMIIGKSPWVEETQAKRCMAGADGQLLYQMFGKLKAKGLGRFYVTNLVKFMPPDWKTVLKMVWVKDCLPLLHQEIKIVQPKFILCLGADASKALLGISANVTDMDGRVETLRYNTAFLAEDQEDYWQEAKVMTVINPRQVIRDQSAGRQLENGLARFLALVNGIHIGATEVVDHRIVSDYDQLVQELVSIESDPAKRDAIIAVDAEWHGQHPGNMGAYLRTIQLSWMAKKALGIKLHEAGGAVTEGMCFGALTSRGIAKAVIDVLLVFFRGGTFTLEDGQQLTFRRKRVVGHFFNADLEWLLAYGLDIQSCFSCQLFNYAMVADDQSKHRYQMYAADGFEPGSTVPAWYRTKYEGGADTGLMAHAIEETASYKLETLAMRYTAAPRYDRQLQTWRQEYCKAQGIASGALEGYGECPDSVLLSYGMYDADVTLRLFYKFSVLLDEDYEGNSCREAFWESQIATPAVLEIHRTGILVDRERIDFLTTHFASAREKMEKQLRLEIKWPDFNIRSLQHIREFLYGHKLNGRRDKVTGESLRIRPEGALSLGLTPLFDTSKSPKSWRQIQDRGNEREHSPSTNKQAMSLLVQQLGSGHHGLLVSRLRDYRFLDQVLKTVLRPPKRDEETDETMYDEDGNLEYDDGLASMCCDDGRVRTHVYQTKETGRWSSARPNLQNISKQRDPDYKRLLGADYKYSLRSVLKASPGHVLVEADYVGAELFGMAVMSGDTVMVQHATRNQLPEEHPDYYDIHSNVAVFAFKLQCRPTKSGLDALGMKHIRIVAKSVIFGIAYGRGAKAIAVAAKEQGISITTDEAQAVIDAIFQMYPRLRPFFDECQKRATGKHVDVVTGEVSADRYLCSCYGRFRRFPNANGDQTLAAEFERQAMNFPIQSMIASAVSRALAYIHDYSTRQRAIGRDLFKVLLQIHDAVLLEVPYEHVQHVCEYVLPTYMRQAVPIYPGTLDGLPSGDGPYYLGIEVEVMNHWGEKLTHSEAKDRNLPTGSGGVNGCVVNYSAKEK